MNDPFGHITDETIISFLLDELDNGQKAFVQARIDGSDQHKKYVQDMRFILEQVKAGKNDLHIDIDKEWETFIKSAQYKKESKRIFLVSKRFMHVAAAFTGVLLLAGIAYLYLFRSRKITINAATQVVSATLPDGSQITLNKNAALSYTPSFNRSDRTVELRGEAFFEVKHHAAIPFRVKVNGLTIEDIGTSFNIKPAGENTEIVVESGKVEVKKGSSTLILSANEQANISNNSNRFTKSDATDKLYQYYRSKIFICNGTPLQNLVQALNNAYDRHILLGNDSLKKLAITVTFKDDSFDEILDVVCNTLQLKYKKQQNNIILYRN